MALETTTTESARSDAKRRAIMDVAREAFMARGYAATSMSEIAAKLGGSKGTLYNYFRSKEELFDAFMNDVCQAASVFDPLLPIGEGRSVRESLIELGHSLMTFLLRDDMITVHRLVISETGRFPELGRIFYEAGPHKGEERFTRYFKQAMAAGHIRPDDPKMVGQRLKDLVMSDVYMRRLWGVLDDISDEDLRLHVVRSVDIFMKAFGL